MLEYVKVILQKVSFDLGLFEKELRKSIIHYLQPTEIESLKSWCYEQFRHSENHTSVIQNCFTVVLE
jgi:hypothetical protein